MSLTQALKVPIASGPRVSVRLAANFQSFTACITLGNEGPQTQERPVAGLAHLAHNENPCAECSHLLGLQENCPPGFTPASQPLASDIDSGA